MHCYCIKVPVPAFEKHHFSSTDMWPIKTLVCTSITLLRRQFPLLKQRREKSSLVLAAVVILFVVCQSIRYCAFLATSIISLCPIYFGVSLPTYFFRLIFKMIEIGLIEDHVSFEVFAFCARLTNIFVNPYPNPSSLGPNPKQKSSKKSKGPNGTGADTKIPYRSQPHNHHPKWE